MKVDRIDEAVGGPVEVRSEAVQELVRVLRVPVKVLLEIHIK